MGISRTSDSKMGLAAVRASLPVGPGLLAMLIVLVGCNATPQIAAVLTGGVTGAATGSPALGFVVGVATDAGATYAFRYVARTRQDGEQDAIAEIAGELPVGMGADWKIEHTIPIGNEHGYLRVVRMIQSPLALCKELAFSIDTGKGDDLKRTWFTSDICKQVDRWKWASAEPAVERWGFLQ